LAIQLGHSRLACTSEFAGNTVIHQHL
jgi:hypothetical protein